MKLKHSPGDFRVRELLDPEFVRRTGRHRVYLVTKRKLTTLEAASLLADACGIEARAVSVAGLKDRQGVTSQHMSVQGGRSVRIDRPEFSVRSVGFASEPLAARHSLGNGFRIRVRDLGHAEVDHLKAQVPAVTRVGLPNYFDEQRFGNLRHGQGWIAKDLMLGRNERALRSLLAARSPRDDRRTAAFKHALDEGWGDWSACRDVAGKFGAHHSLFAHLKRHPEDFAGAFRHVSTRVRLIHLYAFQSALWNRAVARWVFERCAAGDAFVADGIDGPLVFPTGAVADATTEETFPLPGPGLENVPAGPARALLEDVLAGEGMVADQLRLDLPGMRLKGEPRALWLRPRHLRVRAPERAVDRGRKASALLEFELGRGSYATMAVRRLTAPHRRVDPRALARPHLLDRCARGTGGGSDARRRGQDDRESRGQRRESGGRRGRRHPGGGGGGPGAGDGRRGGRRRDGDDRRSQGGGGGHRRPGGGEGTGAMIRRGPGRKRRGDR
ncbi:MAG: tRNA pseudouridine(13) synthase TruD [Planctomycetota bacterium]|jgi:tRNA pseudouridine13 synthase|nr:tRNA pseudouridine(13) synthase TruD [Planctomycetota bacterium]MDP6763359.1 tRNA pseudouridine(13) synthase TruD [Planctomycetota bacterium]MDP6988788.1 tRNA pseudouridine(13) synthase TruD [Planctomycetota bacterium]